MPISGKPEIGAPCRRELADSVGTAGLTPYITPALRPPLPTLRTAFAGN